MIPRPRTALAALLLLAGCAQRSASAPSAASAQPPTASPAEALPGIPLDGLTDAQRENVAAVARETFCYCGCPHTISQCLRGHSGCKHASRMARLAVKYAATGASKEEIEKGLADYYASFDQRARLDPKPFGPPRGDAAAPVTMIEFSDFACPFCQQLRPVLEQFIADRKDRVKLFYVPFPIRSHPNAFEAAQAAEWARDHGMFWPMHDTLFAHAHALGVDDLAGYARDLGGDGDDLRRALESGKYVPRVEAAQETARAAGLSATPTLYLDGRKVIGVDYGPEGLEFTLEDEEEWVRHQGSWERD